MFVSVFSRTWKCLENFLQNIQIFAKVRIFAQTEKAFSFQLQQRRLVLQASKIPSVYPYVSLIYRLFCSSDQIRVILLDCGVAHLGVRRNSVWVRHNSLRARCSLVGLRRSSVRVRRSSLRMRRSSDRSASDCLLLTHMVAHLFRPA